MDQPWQDTTGNNRQSRYGHAVSQQHAREYSGSAQQHQPPTGLSYEPYQTSTASSHSQTVSGTPASVSYVKQEYPGDGDVAMEDADPYNRMKYPSRPNHSHRASAQFLSQEDSVAARRYSPMKALSPSSPYATSPHQAPQSSYSAYTSQTVSARQSPTRGSSYSTPSSQAYYSSPCKFAFLKK